MSRAEEVARRFSLAGILDADTRARERFPIQEIDLDDIDDHPANVAYSMDPEGVAALAGSIARDGLTDIPLVRRLHDGTIQMLSGHRRKAAYRLLSETDPSFSRLPCRVMEDVGDDEALVLLHTANYFVRALNVVERAEATRALGIEVERLREADPALKGERTADIKAAIITAQTGHAVTGKTVLRQEATARKVERDLDASWRAEAEAGRLSDTDIGLLAAMDARRQEETFREKEKSALGRRETSALIRSRAQGKGRADKAMEAACSALRKAARLAEDGETPSDATLVAQARSALERIEEATGRVRAG